MSEEMIAVQKAASGFQVIIRGPAWGGWVASIYEPLYGNGNGRDWKATGETPEAAWAAVKSQSDERDA
jgi:hypothetical protein